jgi:hypothetical protein
MQISTTDGRMKLYGKLRVEKTLHSSTAKPFSTRQLMFVEHRGIIARICQVGIVKEASADAAVVTCLVASPGRASCMRTHIGR